MATPLHRAPPAAAVDDVGRADALELQAVGADQGLEDVVERGVEEVEVQVRGLLARDGVVEREVEALLLGDQLQGFTQRRVAQADGELLEVTPIEISVQPRAARLLIPRRGRRSS